MKKNNILQQINEAISDEVRKRIIMENETSIEKFHITMDGTPIDTCDTQEEAEKVKTDYEHDPKNKGKMLLIDKKTYSSYDDFIEQLDSMGEKSNSPNNNEINENKMNKKEKLTDKHKNQEIDENEECVECGNEMPTEEEIDEFFGIKKDKNVEKPSVDSKFKKWAEKWKEGVETPEFQERSKHFEDMDRTMALNEKEVCSECGKEVCECGKQVKEGEKKKKLLRLSESQMQNLIRKIISESHPGIEVTKKAQGDSKKENEEYAKEVEKKMKDYLNFDGNDNPEFPKPIGKGEKRVADPLSKEDQEFIDDYRGGKALDLTYDQEPSEQFKERLKGSLSGSPETGNEQEEDSNVIKSDLGKKMLDDSKRKIEKVKKEPMYKKDPQPVMNVKESKEDKVVTEEIERMKKLYKYQDKTQ